MYYYVTFLKTSFYPIVYINTVN